jgi:acyl carrier protein
MDGTLNINQVFAGESLDFFVSLSSVVGIVGTSGQANYNAGNTVQDALAQFAPRTACHYMSLNIGMVADSATIRGSDVRVNALRRQGMQPVASSTLDALFAFSMSRAARSLGCTQAALGFTPASLAGTTAINGTPQTPMFAHVRALASSTAANTSGSDAAEHTPATTPRTTFRNLLAARNTAPDAPASFVAARLRTQLCALVGLSDAADIDADTAVSDLGLDSLVAIELRNWIAREFDAPLQSSEILGDVRIPALAAKIVSRSRIATVSTATAAPNDSDADAVSASTSAPTSPSASTQPTSPSSSVGDAEKAAWK